MVDDFDDSGKLASVGAAVEENDAADLDGTPGGADDCCVTHRDGDLVVLSATEVDDEARASIADVGRTVTVAVKKCLDFLGWR